MIKGSVIKNFHETFDESMLKFTQMQSIHLMNTTQHQRIYEDNDMIKLNISHREWGNLKLEEYTTVGANGKQNGYRGQSGTKLHLLRVSEVVGVIDPEAEKASKGNTYGKTWLRNQQLPAHRTARPVYFGVRGLCASNGQHTGVVHEHIDDLGAVTCKRCAKYLPGYIKLFTEQLLSDDTTATA